MSKQDDDTPGTGHPADDGGSIFDRAKHPVKPSGEPAGGGADARTRGPELKQGRDDGSERLGTPPHQTDSTRAPATVLLAEAGERGVEVRPPHAEEIDRRAERRAERLVAFWFIVSVVGTVGFIVTNFVGDKQAEYYTPCMGGALAMAMGGIGFGIILWAKRLMPHEEAVQERHPFASPAEEIAATEETVALGYADTGLARRPLVRRTLLGAGTVLGGLLVVPLLNLTNSKPGKQLDHTRWVSGARLVTGEGNLVKLGDMAIGGIETVFPAVPVTEANGTVRYEPKVTLHDKADSATVLIRLAPGENHPRPGREDWAYAGHVAYSKICTHAGCPVSLYEAQTHHLLCPCHQSVFNVLDGCRAIFGPASRSLPQLAIDVDKDGYFIARHDYTEPVGPAFWERS
ncbi:Rieske 2Fe-2S domain-containing protein [Frankia sp. Cppng1_Ct_nod]|uniref:cytochrome bc1 complex Rieske iron-sulfur subunit n=1 Tax=Frankia sp. Cppng1_Ct_nod TaxID=2897162 RepID=UPI0010415F01|nr:Rieske 2Fe-2S domain-containing protein [Frankia sp. Cppng1_Ct_nod]